ncbi:hypothetical protein [Leifsonia aquatica]|uniref:hypothetical protein n=1 Tax=Leifsonia aquatica TaxID=144185 RepID=UPI000AF1C21F|nr:hypothetical protein [Leifsonia aquatica]
MSAEMPEVMPPSWDGTPEGLRVSLCALDDLGLPMDRRSITTKLPNDPAGYEAFAENVGATVRNTVLYVLKSRTGAEL